MIDLRYATADNFTGAVLYPKAVCKLRRAVAARLAKAAETLRKQDRRLLLWDCYRPTSIQEQFWKRVPDPRYVANPQVGSRHSRGAAVDLALVDRGRQARRAADEVRRVLGGSAPDARARRARAASRRSGSRTR